MFSFVVMMYVVFLMVAVLYAFHAGGEYVMLKRMQYDRPWFAWIPLCNLYALADVATEGMDEVRLYKWNIPVMWFRFWYAGIIVLNMIPIIGGLASTALSIICFAMCYIKIFAYCENKCEEDVRVISYIAAIIPVVATVKFYLYGSRRRINM